MRKRAGPWPGSVDSVRQSAWLRGSTSAVPEAGTIHLQGHDPTTDLSFKNINLQSYDE